MSQEFRTSLKEIGTPVKFNDWGTRGQHNASHLQVCGDYSATVNP